MDRGRCILAMGLFAVTVMAIALSFSAEGTDADEIATDTGWYDGSASEFSIGTEAQLRGLAQLVNGSTAQDGTTIPGVTFEGKTIRLTRDIQLNGDWVPIGKGQRSGSGYTAGSTVFKGTFDGNDHTISGLTITSKIAGSDIVADDALGLFGIVDGGTVENIQMDDVKIVNSNNENAGAVAGLLCGNGIIRGCVNCSAGDDFEIKTLQGTGGIIGRVLVSGTVEDCENFSKVGSLGQNCGGIVGAAYCTEDGKVMTLEGCTNYGAISGVTGTGGIVGLSSANVKGCVNAGDVSSSGASIGGIVGEQKGYGTIEDCTNFGKISCTGTGAEGKYGAGGIVGWIRYVPDSEKSRYGLVGMIQVKDCVNYGDVESDGNNAGGIVGMLFRYGYVGGNINCATSLKAATFAAGIGTYQITGDSVTGHEQDITFEGNVSTTTKDQMTAGCKTEYVWHNASEDRTGITETGSTDQLPADFVRQSKPVPADTEGDGSDTVTVESESEEATVVVSKKETIESITAVTTNGSITLKDATVSAGTLKLSVTDTTEMEAPVVRQAEKTFDVTISGKLTVREILITFNIDVPDGKVPKVYSIVDGNVVEEDVVSYSSSTVTVSTDHNTPFSFVFETPAPSLPDFIPVPDDRGDDFPGYVPTQKTDPSSDDSSVKVAVIVGAIVVVLAAIVAILHRSR